VSFHIQVLMCFYSLPLSSGRARTSLIRPSVCLFTLLVWFSSKIPRILENGTLRMGIFVANGKWFCTKGRRSLVFRMPIRNVPFSIRYICVSKKREGRNLTFVPGKVGETYQLLFRLPPSSETWVLRTLLQIRQFAQLSSASCSMQGLDPLP
jgi:hypothetical protein